jgi:hypothetical protein
VARERRAVPFGAHVLAEYALGVAAIATGLHLGGGARLALGGAGGLVVALNLVSGTPLGLARLVSRRQHHVADLLVVAALATSPAYAHRALGVAGMALAEATAAVLVALERRTRYSVPAAATVTPPGRRASPVAPRVARRLGRAAGTGRRIARALAAAPEGGGAGWPGRRPRR